MAELFFEFLNDMPSFPSCGKIEYVIRAVVRLQYCFTLSDCDCSDNRPQRVTCARRKANRSRIMDQPQWNGPEPTFAKATSSTCYVLVSQ